MAKDINLTSQQWNDIIFEGKNKDYGAYQLRRSSSKRHLTAMLSILVLAAFVSILPALADQVTKWVTPIDNIDTSVEWATIDKEEPIDEKQEMIEELATPIEEVRNSIAFTPPDIVDKEEITEDNQMKSVDELQKDKSIISIATITDGTDAWDAKDIAQLENELKIANAEREKIHTFVEVLPQYPGGEKELEKYLNTNVVYPRAAREVGIEGTVSVRFVVNRSGVVSDVTIKKSPSKILSDEAIRVIKAMPKWIPGKQNGKEVNVYFELPINFQLN